MALYFADTSAWVKLYAQEPGSKFMRGLAESNQLALAQLALVEIHSPLRQKQLHGEIERTLADEMLARATRDFRLHRIVPVSAAVLARAIQCINARSENDRQLRGYDAVQLACALTLAQESDLAGMLCSGRTLGDAARAFGLGVLNPQTA